MAGRSVGEREQMAEMDRDRGDCSRGDSDDRSSGKIVERTHNKGGRNIVSHPLFDSTLVSVYP